MKINPKRKKLIIWGCVTMFLIAPLLSWGLGIIYGVTVSSGFAGGGLMAVLFPIFFVVGIGILIKGFKEPK
jgi:hypothetical protein